MIERRRFLSFLAAPAIVRATSLMPVKSRLDGPFCFTGDWRLTALDLGAVEARTFALGKVVLDKFGRVVSITLADERDLWKATQQYVTNRYPVKEGFKS